MAQRGEAAGLHLVGLQTETCPCPGLGPRKPRVSSTDPVVYGSGAYCLKHGPGAKPHCVEQTVGTSRAAVLLPLCTPPDQEVSIGELMSGGLVSYQGNQHRGHASLPLKSTVTSWGLPTAGIGVGQNVCWIFP